MWNISATASVADLFGELSPFASRGVERAARGRAEEYAVDFEAAKWAVVFDGATCSGVPIGVSA